MHNAFRVLATSIVLLPVFTAAQSLASPDVASAQSTTLRLAPFNSIEVWNSGHAILLPGATPRVTLVKGSLDYSRVAVTDEGVLVIDRCMVKCPRGYELEVEILVPSVTRISLANGGMIQAQGSFARQGELAVAVSHGGTIDVRTMVVDRVTASVEQGGRILAVPHAALVASVKQGGVITYWGDAQVISTAEHGGIVNKGRPEEFNLPPTSSGFSLPTVRRHR